MIEIPMIKEIIPHVAKSLYNYNVSYFTDLLTSMPVDVFNNLYLVKSGHKPVTYMVENICENNDYYWKRDGPLPDGNSIYNIFAQMIYYNFNKNWTRYGDIVKNAYWQNMNYLKPFSYTETETTNRNDTKDKTYGENQTISTEGSFDTSGNNSEQSQSNNTITYNSTNTENRTQDETTTENLSGTDTTTYNNAIDTTTTYGKVSTETNTGDTTTTETLGTTQTDNRGITIESENSGKVTKKTDNFVFGYDSSTQQPQNHSEEETEPKDKNTRKETGSNSLVNSGQNTTKDDLNTTDTITLSGADTDTQSKSGTDTVAKVGVNDITKNISISDSFTHTGSDTTVLTDSRTGTNASTSTNDSSTTTSMNSILKDTLAGVITRTLSREYASDKILPSDVITKELELAVINLYNKIFDDMDSILTLRIYL